MRRRSPISFLPLRTLVLLIVLLALLVARVVMRHAVKRVAGLPVILVHRCSPTELAKRGDGRDLWVRYLPAQQTYVNQHPMTPSQADSTVSDAMLRRWERTVWVAADPRLSYGEVAGNIGRLKAQIPSLIVLLSTPSEAGPVDPNELAQLPPSDRLIPQCLPPIRSNSTNPDPRQ